MCVREEERGFFWERKRGDVRVDRGWKLVRGIWRWVRAGFWGDFY